MSDLETRLKLAKERTEEVLKEVRDALLAQEVNAVVVYSPPFFDSIPGPGRLAFDQLQRNLKAFEIIRLCVLWDKPNDRDKEPDYPIKSIPTIVELVDREVRACLAKQARERHLGPDCDHEWGERRAEAEIRRLDEALARAVCFEGSRVLAAARNVRHKYLAHSLISTWAEREQKDLETWRNCWERYLLDETVDVVEGLQLGILGSDFDWAGGRQWAKRQADAFWGKISFTA